MTTAIVRVSPYIPAESNIPLDDVEVKSVDLDEYRAMVRAAKPGTERILLQTIANTGLRRNEVLAITRGSIRRKPNGFHFVRVQRGKKRGTEGPTEVGIPVRAAEDLAAYADGLQRLPNEPIFKFSTTTYWRHIQRIAGNAGITRNIQPKSFRKLYVTQLLDGDWPLHDVARMVGHKDPKTTLTWYYELNPDKAKKMMESLQIRLDALGIESGFIG